MSYNKTINANDFFLFSFYKNKINLVWMHRMGIVVWKTDISSQVVSWERWRSTQAVFKINKLKTKTFPSIRNLENKRIRPHHLLPKNWTFHRHSMFLPNKFWYSILLLDLTITSPIEGFPGSYQGRMMKRRIKRWHESWGEKKQKRWGLNERKDKEKRKKRAWDIKQ